MYYKSVKNGYIISFGIGQCAIIIDENEHERIANAVANKPEATSGYGYHLKEDLTWELYELPPKGSEEVSDTDAVAIIVGGERIDT